MALHKKNVVYSDVLADAWSTLKKNPIIFAPVLYALGATMLFMLLLIFFSWIAGTSMFWSTLLSSIFVLLALVVFIHIVSTQIIIFSRLSVRKKISCKDALCSAKSFMPKIVVLALLMVLALIPALIILALLSLPLVVVLNNLETANITIGVVSLILTLLFGLFFLILYKSWTLFAFPKLLLEKKKPALVLRETWSLLWKQDMSTVLKTFFITFGIGLGVNIVFSALEEIVGEFVLNPKIIILIVQALNVVTSIIIGLWLTLFVYKVFVARYGVKG